MLNKKGQTEDNIEMVVATIAVILAFVLLSLFNTSYQLSIDNTINNLFYDRTDINSFDAEFIGTDLINVMKYPLDEGYTFGELMANLQKSYDGPIETEYEERIKRTIVGYVTGRLTCTEKLQEEIQTYLGPTYNNGWAITVYNAEGSILFSCAPFYVDWSTPYGSNMTIPTIDTEQDNIILLEGYNV